MEIENEIETCPLRRRYAPTLPPHAGEDPHGSSPAQRGRGTTRSVVEGAHRDETQGARIVTIAREWIGTPYLHQASMKHVGCDCLGLLRGIWRELYGDEPQSFPPYSEDWAEASKEEALANALRQHLRELDLPPFMGGVPPKAGRGSVLQPGDIAIFRMLPNTPAKHCGIIGAHPPPERGRSIRAADRVGFECPSPDRFAIRPSLFKGGMPALKQRSGSASKEFTSPLWGGRFREAKTGGGRCSNEHLTLIHARQNKRVSEEPFSLFWQKKLAYAFRI